MIILLLCGVVSRVALAACTNCPADLDGDSKFNLADYQVFTSCMTGPNPRSCYYDRAVEDSLVSREGSANRRRRVCLPGCVKSDIDGDQDTDLADFAAIQSAIGCVAPYEGLLFGNAKYPVVTPNSTVIGDFDLDGDADFAVGSGGDTQPFVLPGIIIFLNNGDGTFAEQDIYNLEEWPGSVTAGDLDGDGDLDLLVLVIPTDGGDRSIWVLLNRGDGTFIDSATYAAGPVGGIVLGDLDGDGDLDVSMSHGADAISIFLNHGDGTFADQVTFAVGGPPGFHFLGDLDGDGDLDVAIISASVGGCVSACHRGTVSILYNNGDWSFSDPDTYQVGYSPKHVIMADLNGDGALDLAVKNIGCRQGSGGHCSNVDTGSLAILLNNGGGTFADAAYYVADHGFSSMAVADMDGDDDLDVVLGSIYLNNGDGTFTDTLSYLGAGTFVAVDDLDGDGSPDLLWATRYADDVSVLLNYEDGTFGGDATYRTGTSPETVAIGDLNGDGDADLVVTDAYFPSHGWISTISVLANLGDGIFADRVQYEVGAEPVSVAIGDLNGDGDDDLVVANNGQNWYVPVPGSLSVLLNNGDGTFADHVSYEAGDGPSSVAIGDLDGDGDLDLVASSFDFPGYVWVLLNTGDGNFAGGVGYEVGYASTSVGVGDLDGDGDLDIAVSISSSLGRHLSILLNHGDGAFADPTAYGVNTGTRLAMGDLDGDGDLDVVIARGAIRSNWSTISTLLNNGDGTFGDQVIYDFGRCWPRAVTIADMDGDGHADLIVASEHCRNVSVLLNCGSGVFASDLAYGIGHYPVSAAVGDLNGDGDLDLAVSNKFGGDVSVLLNRRNR